MSFQDGWSAIHLDMPARVPHTEYSVESHWEVVKALTSIDVNPDSSADDRAAAAFAFMKAANLDLRWNILVNHQVFGDYRTRMGHAEYAAGGADWDTKIYCPFNTPEEVLSFDFYQAYGSIDQQEWKQKFEQDYRTRCQETPDLVNMTGIYVTTISGMLEVFGWEMLLLAAGTDLKAFGALTNRYADWMMQYFQALAEADVPVVMIHDDIVWSSGPIFAPKWYREFIFPNYKRLFAPLRESGKKILFTSDGNFTRFIDDIAESGVHGFVMEPTTDMAYIAEKYGQTHAFIGNADTRILLNGTREEIRAEVERCMSIGKNCPGFFMAVGNHIPSNTPVENVLYYLQICEELGKR